MRDLIGKMGLAGVLASPEEERAAAHTGQRQVDERELLDTLTLLAFTHSYETRH